MDRVTANPNAETRQACNYCRLATGAQRLDSSEHRQQSAFGSFQRGTAGTGQQDDWGGPVRENDRELHTCGEAGRRLCPH
jgi:hypothetical protein